jgi:hypothetical protein
MDFGERSMNAVRMGPAIGSPELRYASIALDALSSNDSDSIFANAHHKPKTGVR